MKIMDSTIMRQHTVKHGGGTFEAATLLPVEPTSGYAVALGHGSAAHSADRHGWGASIDVAVRTILEDFPSAPYVGTWIERAATGDVLHVDPVVIVPDRESALAFGRALGQLAVWDFATASEVAA